MNGKKIYRNLLLSRKRIYKLEYDELTAIFDYFEDKYGVNYKKWKKKWKRISKSCDRNVLFHIMSLCADIENDHFAEFMINHIGAEINYHTIARSFWLKKYDILIWLHNNGLRWDSVTDVARGMDRKLGFYVPISNGKSYTMSILPTNETYKISGPDIDNIIIENRADISQLMNAEYKDMIQKRL